MVEAIARFYQQCDPARPLPPHDPRYVPAGDARGQGDLAQDIVNALRFSETDTDLHVLFGGHRGGGKSTELLRLQELLEKPASSEDRFFVVYFEADAEDIDVNDTDLPDLLLAIIRQVGKALREREGVELRPGVLSALVDGLKTFAGTVVEFDRLELDLKIARLTGNIKRSPDMRERIRQALEPNVSNLVDEANKLLDEARVRLKGKGYRDLVVIVDNLDRLVLRDLSDDVNTHQRLFLHRGDQLSALRSHVVYTLPISMVFSPRGTTLISIFGRRPDVLPMVRVFDHDGSDDPRGIEVMKEVVRHRLAGAGVDEETAFDSPDTLEYLCRMSGGHLRNLLILVRSSCEMLGGLPLTRAVAERSVRGMSNDFDRALNDSRFLDVLRQVDQTHILPGGPLDQELLFNLSILEYLNDYVWYGVNPAVRLLSKFRPAQE